LDIGGSPASDPAASALGAPDLSARLTAALRAAGGSTAARVTPLHRRPDFYAKVDTWPVGEGISLMRANMDPVAVATTPSRLAATDFDRVAVAMLSPGEWTLRQHGVLVRSAGPEPVLIVVDPAAPVDFRRADRGTAVVVHVDASALHLPPSSVRASVRRPRPARSLYAVYLSFLTELLGVATACPAILAELNAPTARLTRELILDGSESENADDRLESIRRYVAQHLTDPGLSAESIARAHDISVRSLYKLWEPTGHRLSDHIIGLRLDRARVALVNRPHLTIEAIARAHGFVDSTHFTHRFRARFHMTPTAWRAANRPARLTPRPGGAAAPAPGDDRRPAPSSEA
ncbi:MAG: AraC family transcriptional regulator, partial [Actinomycetota bacterium]|nr:AraC family transcriptional regulator [Actinomycetota bacterium]